MTTESGACLLFEDNSNTKYCMLKFQFVDEVSISINLNDFYFSNYTLICRFSITATEDDKQ